MAAIVAAALLGLVGLVALALAFLNFLSAGQASAFGVHDVFTPWPILIALGCFGLAGWLLFS